MNKIYAVTEYDKCMALWKELIPVEVITDIWEVRDCFHRTFSRELFFVVSERDGIINGFLPLCYISESSSFGYFPGESWHGKTWLEQNRLVTDSEETLNDMLSYVRSDGRGTFHLRYLNAREKLTLEEDETGYLFTPPAYGFCMDEYYKTFSGKTAKKIKKEVASFDERAIETVIDRYEDFEVLADMNVSRFGHDSYFSDERFRGGFRNMMLWLKENGMLRMTSVMIDGRHAAIDMGSIFKNTYTLLAGGTSADYPGVAKYINTMHMRYSCEQRFSQADFLCGNFSWKTMFHLEPRPLFKVSNTDESVFEKIAETVSGVCFA